MFAAVRRRARALSSSLSNPRMRRSTEVLPARYFSRSDSRSEVRKTPACTSADGVDFVPLPAWRVFLIQFLNIAGLGPIFGAIMGIMFGPAAFLWIVFGTIFAGAVHDFISAMMSVRAGGESLPELVGHELGTGIKQLMRGFSLVLLILVGAVFVLTPAGLLASMTPGIFDTTFWIACIFIYYALATLLPVDKVIARIYPVFGFALLFMAAGLLFVLLFGSESIPDGFADGLASRYGDDAHPVFPMMFVSIACGAISGFHATQSPMMARCLKNERLARPIFYGAMVAEGLVALIWAAAAITFTGGYDGLREYMAGGGSAGSLVHDISISRLGAIGGLLAILGVVAAPITTGDTALRSARLIAADFMHAACIFVIFFPFSIVVPYGRMLRCTKLWLRANRARHKSTACRSLPATGRKGCSTRTLRS
mgnify:CR=1 FL=1